MTEQRFYAVKIGIGFVDYSKFSVLFKKGFVIYVVKIERKLHIVLGRHLLPVNIDCLSVIRHFRYGHAVHIDINITALLEGHSAEKFNYTGVVYSFTEVISVL